MHLRHLLLAAFTPLWGLFFLAASAAQIPVADSAQPVAEPLAAVPITLIHTNDLHSHFRPENGLLGLGGVARIKTALSKIRKTHPDALFVDAGDWSEGNIYYNEGAGRETLKMMDHLGYDVAVVGNHDWLNGADTILRAIEEAQPKMSLVAANLSFENYPRGDEFRRKIPPYVIREINGVRIAFIGIVTFEFIYDSYFEPVRILSPFAVTRELAAKLKPQCDAIVVISHNALSMQEALLKAVPDIDLVISGHEHSQLTRPIVVERPGKSPAWVVETGSWGRYLGKVEMRVQKREQAELLGRSSVDLINYRLLQMDSSIPEDTETNEKIQVLEDHLEKRYGPIFHDHVADNHVHLSLDGVESLMGNIITDAYRQSSGADLAIDHSSLVFSGLFPGKIRSVDVYNALPAIYNVETDRSWNLHVLPMKGRTLAWLMETIFGLKGPFSVRQIDLSGVQLIYNRPPEPGNHFTWPGHFISWITEFLTAPTLANTGSVIHELVVSGKPVHADRTYRAAIGGGIVQALQYANKLVPGSVPLEGLSDTGQEDWRVVADYMKNLKTITRDKIEHGNRMRTYQPDPGVLYDDITWTPLHRNENSDPSSMRAKIGVTVTNFGATPLEEGEQSVRLLTNLNGTDYSIDPVIVEIGASQKLPALQPGISRTFEWEVVIPRDRNIYPVTVEISVGTKESNTTNNRLVHHFAYDRDLSRSRIGKQTHRTN